jgi:hypothetical protein
MKKAGKKPKSENLNELFDKGGIKGWITMNAIPLVGKLTGLNFRLYEKLPRAMIMLFLDLTYENQSEDPSRIVGGKSGGILNENLLDEFRQTAKEFKDVINRPIKKVPSLRDVTIANVFFENSTRTRLSFELAEKRLSADVVNFSASGSSVKKGETLLDTVNNILAMKVDMVVMRHSSPGAPHYLSKHIKANIINAGDGTHEHPTQALLDAFSMQEKIGDLAGKKIAIIGDIRSQRSTSRCHTSKRFLEGGLLMIYRTYSAISVSAVIGKVVFVALTLDEDEVVDEDAFPLPPDISLCYLSLSI